MVPFGVRDPAKPIADASVNVMRFMVMESAVTLPITVKKFPQVYSQPQVRVALMPGTWHTRGVIVALPTNAESHGPLTTGALTQTVWLSVNRRSVQALGCWISQVPAIELVDAA